MSGFQIDTSGFDRATRELQRMAQRNTQAYGRVIARSYESHAKSDAPWVDRRGNARRKLYGTSTTSSSRVQVEMGGTAPNYKRGPLSAADYMEYLEFANKKKYAVVYPTAEAIEADVLQHYGEAALQGKMRVDIKRNRKELTQLRKQMLVQAATAGSWWQNIAYQKWLSDRSVFNR